MTVDRDKQSAVAEAAHQTFDVLCKSKLNGSWIIEAVKAYLRTPAIHQILGNMGGCFRFSHESSPFTSVDLHEVGPIERQRFGSGHLNLILVHQEEQGRRAIWRQPSAYCYSWNLWIHRQAIESWSQVLLDLDLDSDLPERERQFDGWLSA